jgi:hypothetical protein
VSEARAKSKTKAEEPPADDGELDKIADELYGLRPDEFAAARDEQVKKARAQGQAALARELNKLRKPTQSAWLVNLLWRDQRDVMQQLLDLGEALSRAQAQASGPDMLRLTGQRRELEAALMRRARALAEQAGVTVTAPMEREAQETLSAAVAMPEVADEVRSGRLVKPAAYAGFGAGFGGLIPPAHANRAERRAADAADDDAEPHRVDDSKRKDATPKPDELASRRAASADRDKNAQAEAEATAEQGRLGKVADFEARAAQRERERRAAGERRVADARAAVDNAAGVLADRDRAVEASAQLKQELQGEQQTVRQRLAELQKEVDELRQRQRDLQAEVVAAEQATLAAGRRRDQAAKAHEAAREALEQIEQQQLQEST